MAILRQKIHRILKAITGDRQLLLGCLGILFLLLVILFTPRLVTHDPYDYTADSLAAPGENGHLLGTNKLGQDVYSMLIAGLSTSLRVALISSLISGLIGVMLGGIAGYLGGRVDTVISEIINIFMMIPTFFLILMVVALFGNNIINVMIVIGLTSWASNTKLMRAQALSLRERTFVKSAIVMGETRRQILFKYIIPNGIFPVVANTTMGMSGAILTEASLSFLGLGDINIISWGQMIYDGKSYITSAWWIAAFAGVAIVITVIIFYMLGDGLNHVLNPKRRKGGAQ